MRVRCAFLALLLLLTTNVYGADNEDYESLGWLVANCERLIHPNTTTVDEAIDVAIQVGECKGYLRGIAHMLETLRANANEPACIPRDAGVTVGQMVKIVLKYADQHPEFLHHPADFHVLSALTTAFSCTDFLTTFRKGPVSMPKTSPSRMAPTKNR